MTRALIIDAVAILVWPLTAVAAGIYCIISKPEFRILYGILVVSTLLIPIGGFVYVLGNETMPLIFDRDIGSVVIGTWALYMSWALSRLPESRWTDRYPNSRIYTKRGGVLACALAGIVGVVWGG